MSGIENGYRVNANDMSIQEQLNDLKATISNNAMSGEQQYSVKMTRSIVAGILGCLLLGGGMGYGCNHEDNSTKRDIAKMCPKVSEKFLVNYL